MKLNPALLTAGGTVAKTYVDDVFSAYTYTGNGSAQTIINGIDLAGKGGLVWTKSRSSAYSNILFDTARGNTAYFYTNNTSGGWSESGSIGMTSFNSNGYTVGSDGFLNSAGDSLVSWTFRKAAKFFDVVTYTGTGSNRTVSHSLGVAPGMLVVKRTDTTGSWWVYHKGLTSAAYGAQLNMTSAQASDATLWNSTAPTSSAFSVGTNSDVNASGGSYIAYLFAHDATTDGLIQCGSFTTDGSGNASVTLGWEPQYLMVKASSSTSSWFMLDIMRAWNTSATDARLLAESSAAENAGGACGFPSATGFAFTSADNGILALSSTYIYLAIRRPNKPPTTGTQVYSSVASSAATGTKLSTGFPVDLQIFSMRTGTSNKGQLYDRLRGVSTNTTDSGAGLLTNATTAETATGNETLSWDNDGFSMPSSYGGVSMVFWNFRRAPGVFDVVCDTGTGVAHTVAHGLGVVPELIIRKKRSAAGDAWMVYAASLGATKELMLNMTLGSQSDGAALWNSTAPTSSVFTVGTDGSVNANTATFVTYLFATSPGISKVGSYTGNGTSQTVNCGFTTGARFVLIKRTDSTGGWFVWDSARGIVSANDPHLSLNTTAAEVTTDDSLDPDTSGFIVNQLSATNINVNGASYVFCSFA